MDAQLSTTIAPDVLYIYAKKNSISLPNLEIFM